MTLPNVEPVTEMVDLITASRGYEANVQALQAAKQMFTKTLDILRYALMRSRRSQRIGGIGSGSPR